MKEEKKKEVSKVHFLLKNKKMVVYNYLKRQYQTYPIRFTGKGKTTIFRHLNCLLMGFYPFYSVI